MTVSGTSQENMPIRAASPKRVMGLLPHRLRAGARCASTLSMGIKPGSQGNMKWCWAITAFRPPLHNTGDAIYLWTSLA